MFGLWQTLIVFSSQKGSTDKCIKIWFPGFNASLDAFKAVPTLCHVSLQKPH
jgi:hypothetical protein